MLDWYTIEQLATQASADRQAEAGRHRLAHLAGKRVHVRDAARWLGSGLERAGRNLQLWSTPSCKMQEQPS